MKTLTIEMKKQIHLAKMAKDVRERIKETNSAPENLVVPTFAYCLPEGMSGTSFKRIKRHRNISKIFPVLYF